MACAAALASIEVIEEEDILENVKSVGTKIMQRMLKMKERHPIIGDVKGIGFLLGIELVKDKKSLQPFQRKEQVTERLWQRLFERGIIVYSSTGLAGIDGDALVMGPPFIITDKDIQLLVEEVGSSVEEILD